MPGAVAGVDREESAVLPATREDFELEPPDNFVPTVLRNLALSVLAVCAIAQVVHFLVA
jgi:hypothetical protein